MRAAAITMVWKDYWFLERWIGYYGALFGQENLTILSHGDDPRHVEMAGPATVITIPREGGISMDYEVQRWRLLSDMAALHLRHYDVVICGDVDEVVLPADPARASLADLLRTGAQDPILAPVGVEVLPDSPSFDNDGAIFDQTRHALFSSKYSKPCILRAPARWGVGGHGCYDTPWQVSPQLILAHLQYANPNAFQIRHDERMAPEPGHDEPTGDDTPVPEAKPLPAWGKKLRHRRGLIRTYTATEKRPQAEVLPDAAALLQRQLRAFRGGNYWRYPPKVATKHPMAFELDPGYAALV